MTFLNMKNLKIIIKKALLKLFSIFFKINDFWYVAQKFGSCQIYKIKNNFCFVFYTFKE